MNNEDLQVVLNTLLKQVKTQPTKTEVKQATWIDRRFGMPKSAEEALWRVCWLVVVPAVFTLCYLPIADWLFYNDYPWLTILLSVAIGLIYWGVAQFAIRSAGNLERLVEWQLYVPPSVVFFLIVWEILSRGT